MHPCARPTAVPARGGSRSARVGGGLEPGHDAHRQVTPQEAIDLLELILLVERREGDGTAGRSSTTGAADAVHVILGVHGQFEVDHMGQRVDVQAARRDVRRDQDADIAAAEGGERSLPLGLAAISVDGHRLDPVPVQPGGQPTGHDLGPREDQDLSQIARLHEVCQQLPTLGGVHEVDHLLDRLGRRHGRSDVHLLRLHQDRSSEPPDLGREGGREEEVLATRGEQTDDAADVVDEAHVQHAVRLVQHQHLDRTEIQRARARVVQQPTRRGDEDLHARAQGAFLGRQRHAAVDDRRAQRDVLAVDPEALLHLYGELTRGDHDQGADGMPGRGEAGVRMRLEPFEHGKCERGGLARPGLGPSEEVATRQDQRDGLGLDRCRLRVPFLCHGPEQLGTQAEGREAHC